MKKILILLFVLACTKVNAQVKISDMPTFIGNPSGGMVPIVVNGVNRKIDARYFGYNQTAYVQRKIGTDSLFWVSGDGVYHFISRMDTSSVLKTGRSYIDSSQAQMLAHDTAQIGDISIRTDSSISYVLHSLPASSSTNWFQLKFPASVSTVFGRNGNVGAQESDYNAYYPLLSGSYSNPSWLNSLAWSKLTGTPTTLGGFGVTDGALDSGVVHKSGIETITGALKQFNGNIGIRGPQPHTTEDVGLWSNVSGVGGSGGVLRAGQFYSNYTGTNAFVAGDFYATDSTDASNYDHVVSVQGFTNHLGSGTINNAWGAKITGANSGGNITNAYGYYWGGWTGSGTYTHKYAFYNASSDQSSLNGPLSVNGKFAFGVSDVLGTYQGLFNGVNPIYEYQNSGTSVAFMGTASILFSGANGNDFGIMQNSASRAIDLGVNGTLGIKIEKALSTFGTNAQFNDSVKVNGHIGVRNSQPVPTEDVGLWSNVSGVGGSGGVLRAGQFYSKYTGTNAATGVDVQINDSTSSSNYDHLVGVQSNLIHVGSGKVNNLYAFKATGSNNGDTATNAYGYYWGGWTGTGVTTHKYAFYNAGSEQSSLGGPLSVNGKFAFGVSDVLGTYQGLYNGINPLYEYQNSGTTMAFIGAGGIMFSGLNSNDFGIMQNSASRVLAFGVNGTLGQKIAKTLINFYVPITSANKLSYATNPTMTAADSLVLPDKKYVDSVVSASSPTVTYPSIPAGAIANGTTATTQATTDSSSKLETTAGVKQLLASLNATFFADNGVTIDTTKNPGHITFVVDSAYIRDSVMAGSSAPTEGTYTPTITGIANYAAGTAYSCRYIRNGNTVTVYGKVTVQPTATATITTFSLSLPIASSFVNSYDGAGTGGGIFSSVYYPYIISSAASGSVLNVSFISNQTSGQQDCQFTATYKVL
jgi:hypothetical protein